MPKKLKFKPLITRIKLNPEQAVLSCACYSNRIQVTRTGARTNTGSRFCGVGATGARRSWPGWSRTGANAVSS